MKYTIIKTDSFDLKVTNTIEDKNLGASAFYSVTHSILELFSSNLVCMPIFNILEIFPKNEILPKVIKFWKRITLSYAMKNPSFDQKTCPLHDRLLLD